MSNKVVYNAGFGGFSLSKKAAEWLAERGHVLARQELAKCDESPVFRGGSMCRGVVRHDPLLVACVEALGDDANGACASLAVETIEGNRYRIDEYDGSESVVEPNEEEWTVIG